MATALLCSFAGYVSEAGRKLIQDWYDALPEVELEELQDTLNHLAATPITSWKRPEFDKVQAPLHEVRCKANNRAVRIYGAFDPHVRGRFIFLNATEGKKKGYDKAGQGIALKRWNLIQQRKASTHEFAIEKRSSGANPTK